MTEEPLRPRIYAASLSDYNAGRLHGAWIDATEGAEFIWAQIRAMLAQSPEEVAEEFAIHDHDGFGPLHLSEYESIAHVAKIAEGILKYGVAFAYWAIYTNGSWDQYLDHFEDCYHGHWDSLVDYAQDLFDQLGFDLDEHQPSMFQGYIRFDVEAFARDLSFDQAVFETTDGVYIFDA